ncbi:MAG TPA: MBL fold metallo-hydrolase [Desulfobacteraceae bacterium]|nr:MBL fold metallo-hydrolase [Desulfobacteraceae bacterium]
MILKMMEVGPLMVNCYIVGDEQGRDAAVFDPGGDVDLILKTLANDGLTVTHIFNTHAHWDHVGGNSRLHQVTGAPIVIHRDEAPALGNARSRASEFGASAENSEAAVFVAEGDEVSVGTIVFKVLDLRGHSPAGLGFVFEGTLEENGNKERRKAVICGDALFAGSIGRTDFPGGDLDLLLTNIREKVFTLPDDTLVLPGHGPVSTVGREKRSNPFFR